MDCYLFGCLLSGAGPVLGKLLDDIIPILTHCLNAEEPELRLQYVTGTSSGEILLAWVLRRTAGLHLIRLAQFLAGPYKGSMTSGLGGLVVE